MIVDCKTKILSDFFQKGKKVSYTNHKKTGVHTHTHIYTQTHTKEIRKETLPGFQAAMRGENTCLMAVSPGGFTYPGQLVTWLPCCVITQHFY